MSRVGDSTHGIEASQDHDDKEKREERREKSEERREKKEEKRDPKRGRQRSPNEAARGGADPFRRHAAGPEAPCLLFKPCQLTCCCSQLKSLHLRSSLFSLLSSLFSLSSWPCDASIPRVELPTRLNLQIALRTCHFELCIRPSTPLPTTTTLCGPIPGPAECAKR